MAYGIPVWQWARKKWRYAFKPTKEVPVCHTVSHQALIKAAAKDKEKAKTFITEAKATTPFIPLEYVVLHISNASRLHSQ